MLPYQPIIIPKNRGSEFSITVTKKKRKSDLL